ncbi:hypothetical protein BKA64DRAFT_747181 [Cadophora sp. MPI-SDFR-AT-0126]|nr:hypothetical protein BKA64DRAFT_747181 [Leotiomycetes sp. MPI-SDFR-AT-0126]
MFTLPLLLLTAQVLATSSRSSPSSRPGRPGHNETSCCTILSEQLAEKVLLRGSYNVSTAIEAYYSEQAQTQKPACVVLPSSAEDVSIAVKVLSMGFKIGLQSCEFAIRSGGHTPWANLNNIDDGATLDLSNLNQVTPNADGTVVGVGPWNRWEDVYSVLDPMNLTALGGRSRTIGVGGLVMSAGMSFFSARYGLPCDNVANFEVVLSNGSIVNANAASNSDLHRALKGGSNNFGVVTRLDLNAYDLVSSFSKYANSEGADEYAQLQILYGIFGPVIIVMSMQHYPKPEAPPEPVFGAISALTTTNTFRIASQKNFTVEQESIPDGGTTRRAFSTVTFGNNAEMAQRFVYTANATMEGLRDVDGIVFIISFQGLSQLITSKSSQHGGNLLGLDTEGGDRILVAVTAAWEAETDDKMMYTAIQTLMEDTNREAQNLGVADEFIFMNYASPWQDVYGGVGAENRKEFQRISKLYDPMQLFQKAVPGFKL